MKVKYLFLLIALCPFLLLLWGMTHYAQPGRAVHDKCNRIVSLAPGITQTLLSLGQARRLAGVTSYCPWPDAATPKPVIGGYRETNLEAIARVQPDLVLVPDDLAWFAKRIESAGIKVMLFNNRTFKGYMQAVAETGELLDVSGKARELVAALEGETTALPCALAPEILFALFDPHDCDKPVTELTFLGKDGFYDELIVRAGAKNAYPGPLAYPRLGREAMLALKPDLFIAAVSACKNPQTVIRNLRSLYGAACPDFLLLEDAGDTVPGPDAVKTRVKIDGALQNTAQKLCGQQEGRQWNQ